MGWSMKFFEASIFCPSLVFPCTNLANAKSTSLKSFTAQLSTCRLSMLSSTKLHSRSMWVRKISESFSDDLTPVKSCFKIKPAALMSTWVTTHPLHLHSPGTGSAEDTRRSLPTHWRRAGRRWWSYGTYRLSWSGRSAPGRGTWSRSWPASTMGTTSLGRSLYTPSS